MRTRLHHAPADDRDVDGLKRVKILIVDPLELERIGMRSVFDRYQDIVVSDEAVTWEEAVPKLARLHPDVVIMDISVSHPGLLDEVNDTLTRHPGTRILFFALTFEEATLAAIVRAGIHGCLLKNISSEELVRAVRIVASGDSIIDPRLTGTLFGMIRETRESGRRRTPLSAQERRLLPLVAQGLTNKEIAREMKLSDKTVKNYLVSMYKKLNISRRSQAAALYSRTLMAPPSHLSGSQTLSASAVLPPDRFSRVPMGHHGILVKV
ncbi:MAG: LuxR C-terminal-related transcriptional regulator [Nitrospiraceae bacterium]